MMPVVPAPPNPQRVLEYLEDARKILWHRDRWCQGHMAVDPHGYPVGATSPHAVRWCARGALFKVHDADGPDMGWDAYCAHLILAEAATALYGHGITVVNDELGREHVLRIYDYAIAHAKRNQSNPPVNAGERS